MLDITLYAPGLFDTEIENADEKTTDLGSLELLLSRGRRIPIVDKSYNAALCQLFAYSPAQDQDIPMAAIGRLMDDDKRPEGYWMRADPVHLHADQKSLVLLDANNLSLTQHDALALAACIRQSFTEMGWDLEVPVPTRWYVKMNGKPRIRTSELQSVLGKDIQNYMPTGEDAHTWHRLMNEIQMQLHNADINNLRAERNELPVNSLWLWGSGALPDLLERCWTRVYSDDNNTMGLSMLSNTPCLPLPENAGKIFVENERNSQVLVVMSDFQTSMLPRQQGRQSLDQFENNWCRALVQCLQDGKLHSLRIITRSCEFSISKYSLMQFWKRTRAFDYFTH